MDNCEYQRIYRHNDPEPCHKPAEYMAAARHGASKYACVEHLGEIIDELFSNDRYQIDVYHISLKGKSF